MNKWIPLFDIFLNSPSPQGEASRWFQQQQQQQQHGRRPFFSPNSFISLLLKPLQAALDDSDNPNNSSRCMLIETLPVSVQSRILSFLAIDCRRFPARDLCTLATNLLKQETHLDFWVKKAARQLFDAVSSSNCPSNTNACGNPNSIKLQENKDDEEFDALPDWLPLPCAAAADPVLSWLPLSPEQLRANAADRSSFINHTTAKYSTIETHDENVEAAAAADLNAPSRTEVGTGCADSLDPEILTRVDALRTQLKLKTFSSAFETGSLAKEIRQLCLEKGVSNCFTVLGLTEPWEADDETVSILLSHLSNSEGSEGGFDWPIWVLSSVVLPKMLVLREPASWVLVTATIQYCKLHQSAAVDGLLLPSVLVKEGMNTPLCDVLTRIIRECLHPAHVSSFCQKLLCSKEAQRLVCLPRHRCLLSGELVWTDSLFALFQNILNCSVYLTQDSVDRLVPVLDETADRFSKSLKFGNFLLCLVSKCAPALKAHRPSLMRVAERTNTFLTNSILAKLSTW